jgi:hypothetical protein
MTPFRDTDVAWELLPDFAADDRTAPLGVRAEVPEEGAFTWDDIFIDLGGEGGGA